MNKATIVNFLKKDYKALGEKGLSLFEASWDMPRIHAFSFSTTKTGVDAAEQLFHLTNAPHEVLNEVEIATLAGYRGPSMSVGDIAQVDGVEYLCDSIGWIKRE